MLNRLIHFAMIACLLGCPPSCWLKSAIAGMSSASAAAADCLVAPSHATGCSCCCHKATPGRTQPADKIDGQLKFDIVSAPTPSDDHGTSSGPCQCICGGATVAGHVTFDAGDSLHSVAHFALAIAAIDHVAAEVITCHHWRVPDDDVLSGREICRLHSLMLC